MSTSLSVVIATQGRKPSLAFVLQSLANQGVRDFDVQLVNDGGDPITETLCAAMRPRLKVYHHWAVRQGGVGAAAARNVGLRHCQGPRTLVIDDDCLCPPGLVAAHMQCGGKPLGVIGLRRHVAEAWWKADLTEECVLDPERLVPFTPEKRCAEKHLSAIKTYCANGECGVHSYAWTCHVSWPTAAMKAVGGFWEVMKGCGAEDCEMGLRLHRYGVRYGFMEEPCVYHLDHPQSVLQKTHHPRNQKFLSQTKLDKAVVVRNRGPMR